MPAHKPRLRLVWRGKKTVQEIIDRLQERERILLILPAGFRSQSCVSRWRARECYLSPWYG
jgi:hypothetical protein